MGSSCEHGHKSSGMNLRFTWKTEKLLTMAVFWVAAPCCMVEVYRRIRGASHRHTRRRENLKYHLVNLYGEAILSCVRSFETLTHRSDDGGSKHLCNVGKLLPDYTAQQLRRQLSSYLPPWEPEISRGNSWLAERLLELISYSVWKLPPLRRKEIIYTARFAFRAFHIPNIIITYLLRSISLPYSPLNVDSVFVLRSFCGRHVTIANRTEFKQEETWVVFNLMIFMREVYESHKLRKQTHSQNSIQSAPHSCFSKLNFSLLSFLNGI
jgi:hypothetical protein